MENELDFVVFESEDGSQIKMEVLDYLFYEGKEYALLTEIKEDSNCEACEDRACENCDDRREAFVMEVVPVDDEMEEFVPVDDALGQKLFDIIQNSEFDEEEYELEDEEEE